MKRQSPASSMKRWIAHGPASDITFGWSSSPSFQKHSAERNEKSRLERKLKTTGSAGAWACAHESTVLVVPKSSPSERAVMAGRLARARASAHHLHAGLDELVVQLLRRIVHRLAELLAGQEALLELVVRDVFLPGRGLHERGEAAFPVDGGLGRHLRGRHHTADLRRGLDVVARFLERRDVGPL